MAFLERLSRSVMPPPSTTLRCPTGSVTGSVVVGTQLAACWIQRVAAQEDPGSDGSTDAELGGDGGIPPFLLITIILSLAIGIGMLICCKKNWKKFLNSSSHQYFMSERAAAERRKNEKKAVLEQQGAGEVEEFPQEQTPQLHPDHLPTTKKLSRAQCSPQVSPRVSPEPQEELQQPPRHMLDNILDTTNVRRARASLGWHDAEVPNLEVQPPSPHRDDRTKKHSPGRGVGGSAANDSSRENSTAGLKLPPLSPANPKKKTGAERTKYDSVVP